MTLLSKVINQLDDELNKLNDNFDVRGIINSNGDIYPLGSDTKVLSTVFELICRPAVNEVATNLKLMMKEPDKQNYYPDFTLMQNLKSKEKIAIDVKTTFRRKPGSKFKFTLGGYKSFILEGNENKNIVYNFNEYKSHLIIGFVYERNENKKISVKHKYNTKQLDKIPSPVKNIEFFVVEKWRIAGETAGSGNTSNIGSINGHIKDFKEGKGPFKTENEFLEYWRNNKYNKE